MKSVSVFVLTLVLVSFTPAPLAADSQADPAARPVVYDAIVVTASAAEETLDRTPAAVSVITREDIERRAARDVADLLREVPGLTVIRSGSPGKITTLFSRGGSSKQTLVLWNGIELNNPYFAGFDFGRFSTAGVERIEVVRGPYSALYGSDAVSGVVNILTAGRGRFLSGDFQAGQNDLLNGRLFGAFAGEEWSASGSVELRSDEGFAPNDDLGQESAMGEIRWSPGDRWSIGARARYNRYDVGIPRSVNAAGTAFEPRLRRREEGEELELAIPLRVRAGRTELEAVVSRVDRTDDFEDPEDPFGFVWATTEVEVERASALARRRFGRHTVTGGGEWERASVADESIFGVSLDGKERRGKGVFVEDRVSLRRGPRLFEISAGVRWDSFDTFGSEVSPRAAVAWIAGRNKIRGGFGRAYRAPAVGELYYPFFGNPELEPERAWSWELGYERLLRAGRASATLFRSDFDEQIVYDNVANRFENVGAGVAKGVELGWQQVLSRTVGVTLSYTWLDTEEAETELRFLRRPEHSGSASVRWSDFGWAASAVALHTGRRADLTDLLPFGRVSSDPYTSVDLVVERDLGAVTPYVKVENLLDATYEEIFGYASPGRRALAGVRFTVGAERRP
ncbi:MAG TPA: TonB-dependent receptor [Thermoanaerobaculia bacterium]|nr:TonB-dependent receptor [Thermoanaerobaculia bacterium]